MAVTDFETKVVVVVRDDLAAWQRLNVCAFLMSGVVFFTTPHYDGYAYVLVRLDRGQLAELLEDAWRISAPGRLVAAYDAAP